MATIFLAWELGAGLGHLTSIRPFVDELPKRGHRVIVASRDLSSIHEVLGPDGAEYVQSPFKHQKIRLIEPTCTYAQILHNCGFANVDELAALAGAWRSLFTAFKADLIVCDHAPMALLAARGFAARRAVMGNGFAIPPDVSPLPNLRTAVAPDWAQLESHENQVLENINAALRRWAQPPIDRVSQLFHPVDETFLLTFAELDCYPNRASATYWGKWSIDKGRSPEWPTGSGQKIFAYLKQFPALPNLLTMLQQLPNPTLVYAPSVDEKVKHQFRRANLQFADGRIDLIEAARQCDLAILNGTHSSTATMLLAGKPVLHIPIFLEQGVNADAVARIGAGIKALPNEPAQISGGLQALLRLEQFASSARAFAARHADFDSAKQMAKVIDRAEELAIG
jgi:hypothetical protein